VVQAFSYQEEALLLAVALAGAIAVISGDVGSTMTVGGLSIFLSYASQYAKPFNEISGVITEMQNALACAGRVFELTSGNVVFDNVAFSYVPERPLIRNLNLEVKPGQRVAIVGPTGSGKTTVINLLMRFYDVDSGSIKVEGIDIRNITRQSLRENYGMVLQDTWLKSGTIRMGKPDATEEEIPQF